MFEMTDGTLLEDTGEGYSRKEYEAAYQQALPRINAAKRKVIQDYLIDRGCKLICVSSGGLLTSYLRNRHVRHTNGSYQTSSIGQRTG